MAKRMYDNPYPSVTQALGVLRKIGLEMWFKFNTAQFCNEESSKGKLIGKQIHQAIQDQIEAKEVKIETEYAEEVMNALNSFMKFKKEHPEFILKKAEMVLTSEKYKYNGTMDCLGDDGVPVIFDWKTGKCKDKTEPPIYDEYIHQVAAYVYAYNEQEQKNIKRAYILAIAKDKVGYSLQRMDEQEIVDNFNEAFLPALKIYKFQQSKKKGSW